MTSSSKSRSSRLHEPMPPAPPPTDPAASRAAAYARFIPREELSHFSAWQLGNFGDDPQRKPPLQPQAPPPPAAPDPETLRRQAEQARQQAEREAAESVVREEQARLLALKEARDGGYQDGYRDGLAAMESFKQSHAAQTAAQVAAVIEQMQARLEQVEIDLARRVAGIALDIARQAVRSELDQRPDHVVAVAQEALGVLLVSARHVTVRLHPDDHGLVTQGCAEALSARGARLVADPGIERGGCQVESDVGGVDAQVASRWQRAVAALGRDDPWSIQDDEAIDVPRSEAE
ncbi:flagellar assembly protein FliH [Sphaerotilus hippei]|uniref:Flagellar assembly protein FliH n=1 Tax=Sphaerotilus hippei TaxID=744406 RepID=A0A318GU56_9BURK|nr:FliH/SctL family protein [Sphaerotilus hippei]PXW91936.1 flagellar assembly protein FliH [Sphaerotilus hippei]